MELTNHKCKLWIQMPHVTFLKIFMYNGLKTMA